MSLNDLQAVMPEIVLAGSSMTLLLIGVFKKGNATSLISWLSVISLLVVGTFLSFGPVEKVTALNGHFIFDGFAMKNHCLNFDISCRFHSI